MASPSQLSALSHGERPVSAGSAHNGLARTPQAGKDYRTLGTVSED